MPRGFLATAFLLVALPVSAQQLTLDIHDGLVTLVANGAPVRQVLAEWAKVGGTKVVGAERLSGAPVTLRLENVPEAKALDIILRGAAGYLAATRAVPGGGASSYDRILVLASSSAPAGGGAAAPAAARSAGRFASPVPEGPEREVDANADADQAPPEPIQNPFAGAFAQPGSFPQPGATPFGQPANVPFGQVAPAPFGQPAATMPFGQPGQAMPFGQPVGGTPGLFQPVAPPDQAPAMQSPFGVVGSATPGVVQQPAQGQQQPARPRPPG